MVVDIADLRSPSLVFPSHCTQNRKKRHHDHLIWHMRRMWLIGSVFLFSVQLHGTMRVVMEPLLGDMPLIGALSVFFLKKPVSTSTFNLTLWLPQKYAADVLRLFFFKSYWSILLNHTCTVDISNNLQMFCWLCPLATHHLSIDTLHLPDYDSACTEPQRVPLQSSLGLRTVLGTFEGTDQITSVLASTNSH